MYVFIGDVGLLREEVIKMQVKVALRSTSILLCAIKSSLHAGKGELIEGDITAKISFMAARIILQMREIRLCLSKKRK
jgi:hypothetical protein